MASVKAAVQAVVLLVACYSLEGQRYELELLGTKASHAHVREKRVATLLSSDYVIEVVVNISDLESLQTLLSSLSYPLLVSSTTLISSIVTTTVCSPNMAAYQCRCEEGYAWPYNTCITHDACDAIVRDTCGCIQALPPDGQYCQPIASLTHPVDMEIVLELRIQAFRELPQLIDQYRIILDYLLPYTVSPSLKVLDLNITTVCFPNSSGGLQCECQQQFAWSCDKCDIYGACSNATSQTCGCINALPPGGEFCEPITSVTQCPTPPVTTAATPVTNTTMTTATTPVMNTTMTTTPVMNTTMTTTPVINTTMTTTPVMNTTMTTTPVMNTTMTTTPVMNTTMTTTPVMNTTMTTTPVMNTTMTTTPVMNTTMTTTPVMNTTMTTTPVMNTTMTTTPVMNTTMTTTPVINTTMTTTPVMNTTMTTTPVMNTTMTTTPVMNTTMTTTPVMNTTMTTTPVMNTTMTTTPVMNTTMTTTPVMNTTMTTTPVMNTTMTTTPVMNTTTATTTITTTTTPVMNTTITTTTITTTTTPVTMTTTPVTMTTTPVTMTTTPVTMKTTPVTMTTAIPTTASPTTAPMEVSRLSFTMDVPYDSAFNNPDHSVYQNTYNSIQRQSETYISTFKAIDSVVFRSGSTICDYVITATSFPVAQIKSLKAGIFTELSEIYPLLYDSTTSLAFDPPEVLFGDQVTVTCGPIPEDLNFGTDWTAEWRRDSEIFREDDQHIFKFTSGGATLTVLHFFSTDNGLYECRLKRADGSAFRQRSNGEFQLKEKPVITVSPVTQTVPCNEVREVLLRCSVSSPYEVEFIGIPTEGTNELTHQFPINCAMTEEIITCRVKNYPGFSEVITLAVSTESSFLCKSDVFGVGNEGDVAKAPCDANELGEKRIVCEADGSWREASNNCILRQVQQLLMQSEFLNNNSLPNFLEELNDVALNSTQQVVESPANINAIVEILSNVANLSVPITNTSMRAILEITGILTIDQSKESWDFLNNDDAQNLTLVRNNSTTTRSVSSTLLFSLETVTSSLTNDSFDIETPYISLNKTTFTDTFSADLNSSVELSITESGRGNNSITVLTFASMDNVLPPRNQTNSPFNVINGRVVLVQSGGNVNNVSFTFDVLNDTLGNPQCVFWNFSLFDGLGGWDDEGCVLVRNINETVTCNCNHLTSFSILMSPYIPDDPGLSTLLGYITYIGVGISLACLVICLIIEAVIWRKIRKNNTSYLRHVCIVNIALCLLIADIWFIIGAFVAETTNPPGCTAATFFIHVFYLALFFWMLASGLLLIYRTVSVFDGGLSKKSMMAIGFCLGYGAPLLIAIITIAVTAPREAYIRETGCWLNWDQSKALLAFVIPALLIVAINLVILFVVIYKMLRRRVMADAAQAAERNVLLVIARSVAVLTPFFGLTWGLGVGTMTDPNNADIHISFAFFNSLQGFFILVFGTLLDKKVRSEMVVLSQSIGTGTRSTSRGNSSSSGLAFLRKWRRDGYHANHLQSSSGSGQTHSGQSHSFLNT